MSSCARGEEAASPSAGAKEPALAGALVPFDGAHQAGIETPPPAHLNLVGFDLRPETSKDDFANLMRLWTEDARALCTAETPLGSLEPEMVTTPASLTVTCGLGEAVFALLGFAKPGWLRPVRAFQRDRLDPRWGQSDLVLQICADDPITASHAMRHMVRAGTDYASVAWIQQGFTHANGAARPGTTPRNLFGQVDGTVNPHTPEEFGEQVWIGEGPKWLAGGSAMVVRRIRMNLDTWEELDRSSRENAVGRKLSNGAPLTGKEERDEADFSAKDKYGLPVIDKNSHMARATAPADHPEQKILRRAYNFDLPPDPATPQQLSNSGLVFICYQQDPTAQFEPIQARLDEADLLNTWITHVGSAVYFVPPGTAADGRGADAWWAQSLCAAAGL